MLSKIMMYGEDKNLFSKHFAGLMERKSGLQKKQGERLKSIVEELILSMEDGHSFLHVDRDDQAVLKETKIVSVNQYTPLVLHRDRLYLHRYYRYEARLAGQLKSMAAHRFNFTDTETHLNSIFGESDGTDYLQRAAAKLAAERCLAIISGGPGTGKTSTVVRIIELLLRMNAGNCRIALAAPTGKAAMRLQQSIQDALEKLQIPEQLRNSYPENSSTIHRLLGVKRNSVQFKHNSSRRLEANVVIVDEASMIDLALMSKLVDSLEEESRLILLGDRDQLASVEAGSVLADMIESLPMNTVILKKSYRFNEDIKLFSEAVNKGDGAAAWSLLSEKKITSTGLSREQFLADVCDGYAKYLNCFKPNLSCTPKEAFDSFNMFQVLCGTRVGKRGADALNHQVERLFHADGGGAEPWYPGRPVIVTRNCYKLGLYNGDIGICLRDIDGSLKVWFEDSDGGFTGYPPYRIPEHHTAFAMTIHKSQGSEFDSVVIVLPEEDSQVLSRELIYTAITRAKNRVWMHVDEKTLITSLARKTQRRSGLAEMLRA